MEELTIIGNSVGYPGLTRATVVELSKLGVLEFPRIEMAYGVFIPSVEICGGARVVIRRKDGMAAFYKGIGPCRNFLCSLGFKEFEINETIGGQTP